MYARSAESAALGKPPLARNLPARRETALPGRYADWNLTQGRLFAQSAGQRSCLSDGLAKPSEALRRSAHLPAELTYWFVCLRGRTGTTCAYL